MRLVLFCWLVAQLLAQVKLNAGENRAVFMLSTPVDMRAHLEPVQSASPAGLYLGVVSATFAIDADTDFWSLAREIVDQTRLQLARGEAHLSFGAPGFQDVPLAPGQLARLQKTLLTSRPNTMVSNVGRLAEVAADRAVTSISFATCPMPYQSVFTIASTYNDKLRLSLGYDAAKLSVSNAQALADGVHAILLGAAAGVPEKIDDLVR